MKLGWLDMTMDDVDEYWRRVFHLTPFTVWFNTTGQPAIMLPIGASADGLPVAVQAVGPYGDEATLFRLCAQLESARPWFDRKPAMVGERPSDYRQIFRPSIFRLRSTAPVRLLPAWRCDR